MAAAFRGIRRARRLPGPDERNGWYEILPDPPPAHVVNGTHSVDFAVLGAGACGLAAARRLGELRPDATIAVVEAARIGHGTSGRNAGFMLSHHSHGGIRDLATGQRNDRLSVLGHRWLSDIVREHQIRCDWTDWGQVYVAADGPGVHRLKQVEEGFRALGVASSRLDRDALESITGTRFYSQGMHVDGGALVQPAAMMRGLGETLPGNVTVLENSPVNEIHGEGRFRLVCPEGEVICRELLLTNHVFAEELGFRRHRVASIALFASLTRPLNAQARRRFDTEQFGLLPASSNGSTVRLTLDGRIMMRNTLAYAGNKRLDQEMLDRVSLNHRESIRKRWPELADIDLESTWGGILGFTRNEGSVFGEIAPGLHVALTADVSPMTRGTAAGRLLAEAICAVPSAELDLVRSVPPAAWLPPDPLLGFVARRRIRRLERDEPDER